jgi:hypothetical protein
MQLTSKTATLILFDRFIRISKQLGNRYFRKTKVHVKMLPTTPQIFEQVPCFFRTENAAL